MKNLLLTSFFACVFVFYSYGWGQTGHRVVGEIASFHLSKRAAKNIERILGPESLAMVANWMDEIKSDSAYDSLYTWHYLTVKTGESYDPAIQEKSGDAYGKTKMIIAALKGGMLNQEEKKAYIKMLVHLVGDLHQPLHIGTGEDKGGNDVKVTYFNQNTNLHSVWDTRIIEGQKLSFTEMARHLERRVTKEMIVRATANYDYDFENDAKFRQTLSAEVGQVNKRARSKTSISAKIFERLAMRFSFEMALDENVSAQVDSFSTQTSISMVYQFF